MEQRHLVPVTSNFLLNLNHAAEISSYSIKEGKTRYDLEHHEIIVPPHTRVIHIQMNYIFGFYKENLQNKKASLADRSYYKLYFMPEQMGQYEEISTQIDNYVLNK